MIENEVAEALNVLNRGGLILYPTDTVWGVGCDATNKKAVEKLYKLKERDLEKPFIVLTHNLESLSLLVGDIPPQARNIMDGAQKPVTIIYPNGKIVAPRVLGANGSLAVRIPQHAFCELLLKKFKKPLVSSSANLQGHPVPAGFKEIVPQILKGVAYAVNLQRETKNSESSALVRLLADGTISIIRA